MRCGEVKGGWDQDPEYLDLGRGISFFCQLLLKWVSSLNVPGRSSLSLEGSVD